MTLLKTSVLSFIATAVKMLAALVINKVVAVLVGPSGLALMGQLQNFIQIAMTAAQGGINQGVVKHTAEYSVANKTTECLFSTATITSFFTATGAGIAICIFSGQLADYFLKNRDFTYIFILFGFSIVFFVLNQLLLSIINGLKQIKTFISINIAQSVFSLIFTLVMIYLLGLEGVFIAMVTNQSIILLVLIWSIRHHALLKLSAFRKGFDKVEAKKLFKFSAMTLTSAAVAPISHLIVRDYLGNNLSWQDAGYWQAIWYISSMYLMVVTTTLGIYYLPKLAELTCKKEIKKELINGYKIILPIVVVMALLIYVLRDFIIQVLFSKEFAPMSELFKWQLIGDVIKLASWLLSYVMLAKAMTKLFIATEIVFSVGFVFLTQYFVGLYGLNGVTYAYALNYSVYFMVVAFIALNYLRNKKLNSNV
ncbi:MULTISPECIES: O-antigen translocase [unclassified Pseudoalteromonas]|uniref:O-antigen translocase n=1 Tax=unclassified Pseudoalteromonas TaxID=194690 RepID=UPI000C074224|nr:MULTISPECIES: O-antigen translocase [unclassified Pseudoalteromonas]MDP2636861.1 O-antigen translocase [Pseudoalteromonas sp. 1_MG-2023]PHN88689.1 O-antigen flippase [Pseudoalteromonas sp. 3D05]